MGNECDNYDKKQKYEIMKNYKDCNNLYTVTINEYLTDDDYMYDAIH